MDGLCAENDKLIDQLLLFSDEMEDKLQMLKKKDKLNMTTDSMKPNKDIEDRVNKLKTKAQKIKYLQNETQDMQRNLENTYGYQKIVELENQYKNNQRIMDEQY